MRLPDFLYENEYGAIRIVGSRIDLLHVVDYYREGYTPELIAMDLPSLSLFTVERIVEFYENNREPIDAYVKRCNEKAEQLRASLPKGPTLEELKRRLETRRQAKIA